MESLQKTLMNDMMSQWVFDLEDSLSEDDRMTALMIYRVSTLLTNHLKSFVGKYIYIKLVSTFNLCLHGEW